MTIKRQKVRVILDKYWDDELTGLDIAKALNLNLKGVTAYRRGSVQFPKIEILEQFREFFSQRTGKEIELTDLFEFY